MRKELVKETLECRAENMRYELEKIAEQIKELDNGTDNVSASTSRKL